MNIILLPLIYIIICIAGNSVLPPVDYKEISEAKTKSESQSSQPNNKPKLQNQSENPVQELETNP